MTLLFSILIIISSILVVLTVLAQNSKGNGLNSGLGGASQLMGTKRTTDIVEKLTWGFAIALLAFCLSINLFIDKGEVSAETTGSVNLDRAKKAAQAQGSSADSTATPVDTTSAPVSDDLAE
jgi:preprotein translocase subunit SecG